MNWKAARRRCWMLRRLAGKKCIVLILVSAYFTTVRRSRQGTVEDAGYGPEAASPGPPWALQLKRGASPDQTYAQLHRLLTTAERHWLCPHPVLVGGRCLACWASSSDRVHPQADGEKAVCADLLRPNCSVLSFGTNHDFSFDLAMEDLDCTVHAFDPTMGVTGFRRSDRVFFHGVGIGAQDDFSARFPVANLGTIIQLIPLQQDIIDYVKLDVECSEWEVLHQQLTSSGDLLRVRQLAIEFHLWQWKPQLADTADERARIAQKQTNQYVHAEDAERFVAVLLSLQAAGFQLVHSLPYHMCHVYESGCLPFIVETLWVNTRLSHLTNR
ncbi:uncharacterized protein LOC119104879 [Pollicipes pollicipes]|uniref:uncharacterized protein LOC119104879 n=1 Tax=Pollicipes pollicipes TaxID=41117 RepID=UPI0018849561|nr:uncharacterized protein LOC119104879 [Pollicipes pollicipes]